jgi:hypothetical protein
MDGDGAFADPGRAQDDGRGRLQSRERWPTRSRARWSALYAAAASALLLALGASREARAQSQGPLDTPRMTEDMHTYFHGEKWEGPVFFGAGLASAGLGAFLVTRDDAIARGAAYPLFGVGLIQLLVGAVVFLRTDAQVAALDKKIALEPAAFKRDERARIGKVNTQFIVLAVVESALIAGGTAMAVLGAQNDCCRTTQGVGLGLAAEGAVMLGLDLFAAARARDYTISLDRFDPLRSAASPPGSAPQGSAPLQFGPITLGVRF